MMGRSRYNTNLASEFWVLSTLYRLGVNANLTLGNKKAVDIVIVRNSGTIFTVDVKGLAGPYDWPADYLKILDDPNHFYIFVCFEGKIADPTASPSVWIVPSTEVRPFIKPYNTRSMVSRTRLKEDGGRFMNAWWHFSPPADAVQSLPFSAH